MVDVGQDGVGILTVKRESGISVMIFRLAWVGITKGGDLASSP